MAAARSTSLSGASGSTRCRSSRLCEVRSKNGSGSISRSLASGSRSAWYSIAEDGATVSHTRLSSGLGQARSASPTSRKLMRLLVTSRAGVHRQPEFGLGGVAVQLQGFHPGAVDLHHQPAGAGENLIAISELEIHPGFGDHFIATHRETQPGLGLGAGQGEAVDLA